MNGASTAIVEFIDLSIDTIGDEVCEDETNRGHSNWRFRWRIAYNHLA